MRDRPAGDGKGFHTFQTKSGRLIRMRSFVILKSQYAIICILSIAEWRKVAYFHSLAEKGWRKRGKRFFSRRAAEKRKRKVGKRKRGRGNHKDAEGSGKEMIAQRAQRSFLNHEIIEIREWGKKWEPPTRRGLGPATQPPSFPIILLSKFNNAYTFPKQLTVPEFPCYHHPHHANEDWGVYTLFFCFDSARLVFQPVPGRPS